MRNVIKIEFSCFYSVQDSLSLIDCHLHHDKYTSHQRSLPIAPRVCLTLHVTLIIGTKFLVKCDKILSVIRHSSADRLNIFLRTGDRTRDSLAKT